MKNLNELVAKLHQVLIDIKPHVHNEKILQQELFIKEVEQRIINLINGIPSDYKDVTGFDTPAELAAYEKGREHEQSTIFKWIKKWDGSTTSHAGQLLHDKFIELNKKI